MTYYSALHYAAKAEKSATSAANSARTAQTAAAQASQASGKIIQLGFDGVMEDGKLVFKHAPSGVEIPYSLLDDYEYELDLAYNGDLDSLTTMVVKNGADTISFVSALHRSSTEPARVADMDAVMRYDTTTGYRWLFKATFKIAPNGAKVFLLYPVVAAKDYSNITNCITEIPQDIKLELNNGTLTLKAGSKAYNGDGTVYTRITDCTATPSWGTATDVFVFPVVDDSQIISFDAISRNLVFSGDDTPTFSGNYAYWFDTTVQRVKYTDNAGASWSEDRALPLCIVSTNNNKITSIDQVFNGFGYIGSTVFALPGVKGLIPNGRNDDGSLNNIEFTVDSVWLGKTIYNVDMATLGVIPTLKILNYVTYNDVVYNEEENKNRQVGDGNHWRGCLAGSVAVSDMKFTSLTPKQAFHAVDYQDVALKQNFQVVSTLPSSPQPDVFYFIPG